MQEAFSHLLGEQNEFTQELASQGMSIVYELGDASMQKNLVVFLVTTLTGSGKRKRAIKVKLKSHLGVNRRLYWCMILVFSLSSDKFLGNELLFGIETH